MGYLRINRVGSGQTARGGILFKSHSGRSKIMLKLSREAVEVIAKMLRDERSPPFNNIDETGALEIVRKRLEIIIP